MLLRADFHLEVLILYPSPLTQVQSLTLRTQPPGSTPAAHADPLKTTTQGQMVAPPLPKSPTGTLGNIQQPDAIADGPGTETRGSDLPRLSPAHQLVVPSKLPFQPLTCHMTPPVFPV